MNSISTPLSSGALPGGLPLGSDPAAMLKDLHESSDQQTEKVGKEFESVFLSLLLKEMRNTLDTGEGGLFGGEQSDTFGGMFDQFMGQHLSESSPLGIADAIKSYLSNVPIQGLG